MVSFSSPVIIRFKNESFSWRFNSEFQMVMRVIELPSVNSCNAQTMNGEMYPSKRESPTGFAGLTEMANDQCQCTYWRPNHRPIIGIVYINRSSESRLKANDRTYIVSPIVGLLI